MIEGNIRVKKIKALNQLKSFARKLKMQLFVLYLAYKDARVPWYATFFAFCVVAYAFSPIDLIPDFIPILGYLDDLIIVPLGIKLALKMIPEAVLKDCKLRAAEIQKNGNPSKKNWLVGFLFVLIWIMLAFWLFQLMVRKSVL